MLANTALLERTEDARVILSFSKKIVDLREIQMSMSAQPSLLLLVTIWRLARIPPDRTSVPVQRAILETARVVCNM